MCKLSQSRRRGLWTLVLMWIPWTLSAAQWPQWGGPGRDFTATASASLQALPANGPRVLWKQDLGPGFSAIVSDGERLVTMYRRGDQDVIACLSAETGKRLWEHTYDAPVPDDGQHLDTSYGEGPNSTPLLAHGRVYTLGFSGIVTAVNLEDGTPVWTHDLEAEYGVPLPYFGHASSPIRHKDTVIFIAGGAFAFDGETGVMRWNNRTFGGSYASPLLVPRSAGPVLIGGVAGEVVGLDPDTGELLWRHEHANQHRTILSSPVFGDDDHLFVSAFFLGSIGLKLSTDGRSVTETWEIPDMQVSQSNAVRVGDHVYGFHRNVLTAVHAATGKIAWRHRGLRRSNLLRMGDRFLLLDDLGQLTLVSLSPEGPTVHGEARISQGRSWTVPTLLGSRLFVRDEESIRALDLRTGSAERSVAGPTPLAPEDLPKGFQSAKKKLAAAADRGQSEGLATSRREFEAWTGSPTAGHLVHFYIAFAAWKEALGAPEDQALALVNQAVEHAKAAIGIHKEFADAHALLARIYPMYYRLDPRRAAVIGPMSDEHLNLALRLEPANPRVVVAEGMDLIYSPLEYGGDPAAGLKRVEQGLELFESGGESGSGVDLDWGRALAWAGYGQALLGGPQPDPEQARRVLRRALEIEPQLASAQRLLQSGQD